MPISMQSFPIRFALGESFFRETTITTGRPMRPRAFPQEQTSGLGGQPAAAEIG
jgi:hypothetical protein